MTSKFKKKTKKTALDVVTAGKSTMINACAASSLLIFGVGLVTLFSFSIALDPSGCVSIEKARIVANTCVCDAGYACRHISGEPGHTVDYNCAHGLLHGVVGEDPSFVLDKYGLLYV